MPGLFDAPVNLTPNEFEIEVASLIQKLGITLSEFEVRRLPKINAADGTYEIDITARFEALGVSFLVLIECKHHKNPIKREVVQVLNDRLRAVAGHKGMIFSTSKFQKGAIDYAQAHGIALVQIADGKTSYNTRSHNREPPPPPSVPNCVGWLVSLSVEGNESHRLILYEEPERLFQKFGLTRIRKALD
jgi:restriction system protein